MKISYECTELIEELQADIAEFGDVDMYAFFDTIDGMTFLTNYDFIIPDEELSVEELKKSVVQIMKASKILEILKEQNSII